jgi:serine/threonine-protein kinase HipA
LLLMDRHFRQLGLEPAEVSSLDRLAYLSTRTMGALTYHPPRSHEELDAAATFDLHTLARQALEVHSGQAADVLPQLLRAGGSPGGARPKVLVGFEPSTGQLVSGEDDLPEGFEHWIVKFAATTDKVGSGPVEYAYALMAGAAGLELPPARIFETSAQDRFFGVKRFDRAEGNRRVHLHTFGNLIHADFRVPGCDYAELLKATNILTRNHQDVLRAFRLMAFNVLAHNRDDHVKNVSFTLELESGQWALGPAYDLTFAAGPGGEHSTTVAGEGKDPGPEQMLKLAGPADISAKAARGIIDEVRHAIDRWGELADQARVPAATRDAIARQIAGP